MPILTQDLVAAAANADPDRTLATTFLPAGPRERVITLILFNHELARARAVVSDAGLAAIRLQWWRDTIEQIYGGATVRAWPIATALAQTIGEAHLPQSLLNAMIDGYEAEQNSYPFQSWHDLEAYLDVTQGNLNRACLLAWGHHTLTTARDTAARQAGIATGLANIMRDAPRWLTRRCINLPLEALSGQDHEALFAGHVSPTLNEVLKQVIARIVNAQLACNEALKSANLGESLPILASATLAKAKARAYLPKMGVIWQTKSEPSLISRQLKLTYAVARGRI